MHLDSDIDVFLNFLVIEARKNDYGVGSLELLNVTHLNLYVILLFRSENVIILKCLG